MRLEDANGYHVINGVELNHMPRRSSRYCDSQERSGWVAVEGKPKHAFMLNAIFSYN